MGENVSSSCSCHRMTTGPTTICKFEVMHFVLSILGNTHNSSKNDQTHQSIEGSIPPVKTLKDLLIEHFAPCVFIALRQPVKNSPLNSLGFFSSSKTSPGAPSAQHVGVGPDNWICPELIPWKKYSYVFSIFMWITVGHTICLQGFCLLVVFNSDLSMFLHCVVQFLEYIWVWGFKSSLTLCHDQLLFS